MILPISTASNLYWLGRYFSRAEHLLMVLPFGNDQDATHFANAFVIPKKDAVSLNAWLLDATQPTSLPAYLDCIKQNIQATRGVLSSATFEAFYALDQYESPQQYNTQAITTAVAECKTVIAGEHSLVQQFFNLGYWVENLDMDVRLGLPIAPIINQLNDVVALLPMRWSQLSARIVTMKSSYADFDALCNQIHSLLQDNG